MRIPAESLSGSSVRDKIVTAAEAVRLIHDGDSVVVEGFMGQCFAEELALALEQRFLLTGTPRDLGLVFTMAAGNRLGQRTILLDESEEFVDKPPIAMEQVLDLGDGDLVLLGEPLPLVPTGDIALSAEQRDRLGG